MARWLAPTNVSVRLMLVILAISMAPGPGQGDPPAKGKKPAAAASKSTLKPEQFATPEKAFETIEKLLADKNYNDYVRCYTDDGLAECAGSLRMVTAMLAAFPPPPEEKAMVALQKQIKQLVEKYKPADQNETPIEINLTKSAEEQAASMRAGMIAAGKAIQDRAGFVAAATRLLFEGYTTKTGKSPTADTKLVDLKVDGQRAQAKMIPGWLGDPPADVVFRRIDGQWKIDSLGSYSISSTDGGTVTLTPLDPPAVPDATATPEKPSEPAPPTSTPRPSNRAMPSPRPEKTARAASPEVAKRPIVEAPDGPTGPAPQLVVEQPKFNFGEAESGSDVRHTFVLKNAGDAPLEITKFWQSGGITHTPAGRTTIAPGEQLELEATLSLKAQRAKVSRELRVYSNDPVNPELHLVFSGVAVPRAKVDPPRVELGEVVGSGSASKTFKVTGERGLSFKITGTKTSGPEVTVDVKTVTPGTNYEATVTVSGPLPAGKFKGWVHLITDQRGEYHVIAVPVTASAER